MAEQPGVAEAPKKPAAMEEPLEAIADILYRFHAATEEIEKGEVKIPDGETVTTYPGLMAIVHQHARAIEAVCRYYYSQRPREGA